MPAGADVGGAMTQIVHDLAPGANLDFASAFNGELSFANNIRALYNAGAKVIADDVVYFNEPFYQDGPIAVAVNEVTAGGASYFSSAGNDNIFSEGGEGENEIASFEAPAFHPVPDRNRTAEIRQNLHGLQPGSRQRPDDGDHRRRRSAALRRPPVGPALEWRKHRLRHVPAE